MGFDLFNPFKWVKAGVDLVRMTGGAKPIHTNFGKAVGRLGGQVLLPMVAGAATGYALGSWLSSGASGILSGTEAAAGTAATAETTAAAGTSAAASAGATSSLFSTPVVSAILGGGVMGAAAMSKVQLDRLNTVSEQLSAMQQQELQRAIAQQREYEAMLADIEKNGKLRQQEQVNALIEQENYQRGLSERQQRARSFSRSDFFITQDNFLNFPLWKTVKRQRRRASDTLLSLRHHP